MCVCAQQTQQSLLGAEDMTLKEYYPLYVFGFNPMARARGIKSYAKVVNFKIINK